VSGSSDDLVAQRAAEPTQAGLFLDFDGVPFLESTQALLVIDDSGTYVAATDAALKLLGYPRQRLIGMQTRELMQPMEPAELKNTYQLFLQQGEGAGLYWLETGRGERVEFLVHSLANVVPGFHIARLLPPR